MPGWLTFHVMALVAVAALFGGMLTFMAIFTPLIFRNLPEKTAREFLRAVFPVYYRVGGLIALAAALPVAGAQAYKPEIAILLLVAAGFVFANRVLRPAVERARERNADARFRRLHRASVQLHLVQFVGVTVVLFRLAQ